MFLLKCDSIVLMRKIFTTVLLTILLIPALFIPVPTAVAQTEAVTSDEVTVFMFGRDDCGFCKAQFEWMEEEGVKYEYLTIPPLIMMVR